MSTREVRKEWETLKEVDKDSRGRLRFSVLFILSTCIRLSPYLRTQGFLLWYSKRSLIISQIVRFFQSFRSSDDTMGFDVQKIDETSIIEIARGSKTFNK